MHLRRRLPEDVSAFDRVAASFRQPSSKCRCISEATSLIIATGSGSVPSFRFSDCFRRSSGTGDSHTLVASDKLAPLCR